MEIQMANSMQLSSPLSLHALSGLAPELLGQARHALTLALKRRREKKLLMQLARLEKSVREDIGIDTNDLGDLLAVDPANLLVDVLQMRRCQRSAALIRRIHD
jgi:hypothetical protein